MSFEQTDRLLDLSSASTPRVDANPSAPCFAHSTASAVPGAARKMRPPAMLLKYSVPSGDAVRLSGKSVVPGTVTSTAGAAEAAAHRLISPAPSIEIKTEDRSPGDDCSCVAIPLLLCDEALLYPDVYSRAPLPWNLKWQPAPVHGSAWHGTGV